MWDDHTPWPLDYSDMLTLHVHWSHISILLFSVFHHSSCFYAPRGMPLLLEMCATTQHAPAGSRKDGLLFCSFFFGYRCLVHMLPCRKITCGRIALPWPLDYSDMLTLHVHWSHKSILLFSVFHHNVHSSMMLVHCCDILAHT
jgi:hypothetical protein